MQEVGNLIKMKRGFTLLELIVCVALIGILTMAVLTWYGEFKERIEASDGKVWEIEPPDPPDYRDILKQYGVDVGELTDEEIQQLMEELRQ